MQENLQQKLTPLVNEIKNLPTIVKTRLGFDSGLRGALRTQSFNQLLGELDRHLSQLQFQSNDPKEKEKTKAFAEFLVCTYNYYEDLKLILSEESIPPSSSSFPPSRNLLKTSEDVLAASKENI